MIPGSVCPSPYPKRFCAARLLSEERLAHKCPRCRSCVAVAPAQVHALRVRAHPPVVGSTAAPSLIVLEAHADRSERWALLSLADSAVTVENHSCRHRADSGDDYKEGCSSRRQEARIPEGANV